MFRAVSVPASYAVVRPGIRAVAIGAICVCLLSHLSILSNLRYGRYITAASLPNGATFFFVVVLLINAVWRRLVGPRRALSLAELALVFSMLYVSAALPQAAVAETLVTLVAAPAYLPRGNPAINAFGGNAPRWLLVQSSEAIEQFYKGFGPAGGRIPWGVWVIPLLGWTVFVALLLFALHCLSRIFTHRWVREERVSFPLMDLPLELLGLPPTGTIAQTVNVPSRPLWRNPLLYIGAALPTAMIGVGQFHNYFPTLPAWEQCPSWPIGALFTAPPWNGLGDFNITFWPLVIGIGFLLNSEVAISIWAFHLLFRLQMVLWSALGYGPGQGDAAGARGFKPLDWAHNMEFGGTLVLCAALLASVQTDVRQAVHAAFMCQSTPTPVSPGAVLGFALANTGMLLWAIVAGASPLAVATYLLFLYAIVVCLGRMVAAGGLYLVDNAYEPQPILYGLTGTEAFTRGTHFILAGQEALVGRADMSYFYFAINESKFTEVLLTDGQKAWRRWHGAGLLVAVTVALVSSYIFILLYGYRYGAATFKAWPLTWRVPQVMERTTQFLNAAQHGPDTWTWAGMGSGAVLTGVLLFLNRTFLWWRLSPFGFVMASSYNVGGQIWSSTFLGWLAASLIRRYAGLPGYRALRPLFLGFILGDAVTVSLMALVEIAVGVKAS